MKTDIRFGLAVISRRDIENVDRKFFGGSGEFIRRMTNNPSEEGAVLINVDDLRQMEEIQARTPGMELIFPVVHLSLLASGSEESNLDIMSDWIALCEVCATLERLERGATWKDYIKEVACSRLTQ